MTTAHIVKSFDEDLQQIATMVAEMGGRVEAQISDAVTSLVRRDADLGEKVRANDQQIDDLEFQIDADVVRVLALRQPQAQDLRAVVSVIKIATNLERIGDYAKNIAKRSSILDEFFQIGASADIIRRMSVLVQGMLKDVLDAYSARDIALADDVRIRDEEVDQMHNTLFREMLTYMMEDPRNISPCMHLLFIAKNVERMGDHVTGIAEQVHFIVSGTLPNDERPKLDTTSVMSLDRDNKERRINP